MPRDPDIPTCPNCFRPKPTTAVKSHGDEPPHRVVNCLCATYCFQQGSHTCKDEHERVEYMARLLKIPLPEYLEEWFEWPEHPLRAAPHPAYGDCPNCNRPIHLMIEHGGCRRSMQCTGLPEEQCRQIAQTDALVITLPPKES